MSDSLVLSTFTEGVILVVHAGKTQKEAVLQAKKLLNGVNARILGVVLNGVDFRNRYGYYSYYHSGNGDGEKEKKSGSV
jgi:Mrp family chromosome partitioning ATPase